jgi:hypothetical protein
MLWGWGELVDKIKALSVEQVEALGEVAHYQETDLVSSCSM